MMTEAPLPEDVVLNEGIPPRALLEHPEEFDTYLPLLSATVKFANRFQQARPNKRDGISGQWAIQLVQDLPTIKHALENLALVGKIEPSFALPEMNDSLARKLAQATRTGHARWSSDKIEQAVKLHVAGTPPIRLVTDRMLAAFFNAPHTTTGAVDLHYKAASAMIDTEDPTVRE